MKNSFVKAVFWVLVVTSTSHAQNSPKPLLIDEFSKAYCDDFLARVDNIFIQLQQNRHSNAYIVINGEKDKSLRGLTYEDWINNQIKFRGFDENRLNIIRAKEQKTIKIRMWIVPDGAKKPDFIETKWNLKLPPDTKPYIFYSSRFADGICHPEEYLSLDNYSEYIKANSDVRGNIVIETSNRKKFRKEKEYISNLLVEKYKVDKRRLKFFYVRLKRGGDTEVEVWLVPRRNRI